MSVTVYVSLAVTASVVAYTVARCPECGQLVLSIPRVSQLMVNAIERWENAAGSGYVVPCKRCRTLCEVIEHEAA